MLELRTTIMLSLCELLLLEFMKTLTLMEATLEAENEVSTLALTTKIPPVLSSWGIEF